MVNLCLKCMAYFFKLVSVIGMKYICKVKILFHFNMCNPVSSAMRAMILCLKLSLMVHMTGLAKVWVTQKEEKPQYTVGDTAVIQCKLHTDQSDVKGYKMRWVVSGSGHVNNRRDLLHVPIYAHANTENTEISSKLTLRNLSTHHTDKLVCVARFLINGTLTQLSGNGTILNISKATHKEGMIK